MKLLTLQCIDSYFIVKGVEVFLINTIVLNFRQSLLYAFHIEVLEAHFS